MVNPSFLISDLSSSFKANIGFIRVDIVIVLLQVFTEIAADDSMSVNATVMSFPITSLLPVQYSRKFSKSTQKVKFIMIK